jgi:hypothetical protein
LLLVVIAPFEPPNEAALAMVSCVILLKAREPFAGKLHDALRV